ncbi:hypothetical protein I2492_16390 [Budviciaceae bacterium CWB-B4]|uniref:Uncharacterized protein n=1 Tax=Limnobaculum xujianqingii TaxID=2738837 RepID=A0A9D7FW43_9GAMM|nr:hypothetical protein [Limnobaculum xujianqingii]MBK5074430.1 hypothetical protein [Limnobaculum xujianqingii]MBK5177904.1 hypothetical protein [Limnobaculum xujianqingii]
MMYIQHYEKIKNIKYFSVYLFFAICCSFNFIPFISAEVQPVVGVFIIIVGFFSLDRTTPLDRLIIFIFLMFLSLMPSLVWGIYQNPSNVLTYFFYMIGPAIFYYFYKSFYFLKVKNLNFFVGLFSIITIIQVISPESINSIINPIFELIVKRGKFGLDNEIRGVGILYSEPAHAARYIYLLMVFFISLKISPQIFVDNKNNTTLTRKNVFFVLIGLFIMIVFNKSGTLFSLVLFNVIVYFILISINLTPKKIGFFILLLPTFIVSVSLIYMLGDSLLTSRLSQLIDSYNNVKDNFSIDELQYFGSIRFISVLSGYAGGILYPLGVGIGEGGNAIFEAMKWVGFDLNSISFLTTQDVDSLKPNSYFSQIVIESGIIGWILVGTFSVFCFINISVKNNSLCFYSSVLLTAGFQLLFFSTTTITSPWLSLALGLYGLKSLRYK